MKYLIIVIIIFICGLVGYGLKNKFITQYKFLSYLKLFLEYLGVNIIIYKNNLHEIINSYIIQQNNKTANYNKIFQINNKNISINVNLLDEFVMDNSLKQYIINYFNSLGKSDVENEINKNNELKKLLNDQLKLCKIDCKEKGDLYFKLFLAIGVVIGIILW